MNRTRQCLNIGLLMPVFKTEIQRHFKTDCTPRGPQTLLKSWINFYCFMKSIVWRINKVDYIIESRLRITRLTFYSKESDINILVMRKLKYSEGHAILV